MNNYQRTFFKYHIELKMELKTSFGNLLVEQRDKSLHVSLVRNGDLFKGIVEAEGFFELDEDETNAYLSALKKAQYNLDTRELSCKKFLGIPSWKCTLKRSYLDEDAQKLSEKVDELENEVLVLKKKVRELEIPVVKKWKLEIHYSPHSGSYELICPEGFPNWPLNRSGNYETEILNTRKITMEQLHDKISSFNGYVQIYKMDLVGFATNFGSCYDGTIEGIFSEKKQVFPDQPGDYKEGDFWNFAPQTCEFKDYRPWNKKYLVVQTVWRSHPGHRWYGFIPYSET